MKSCLVIILLILIHVSGKSSDVVQRLYDFMEEDTGKHPSQLRMIPPEPVVRRLKPYGLKWSKLSGLLQRAVLYDAGFIFNGPAPPIEIFIKCNDEKKSMNNIILSLTVIQKACGLAEECAGNSARIHNCSSEELTQVVRCASWGSRVPTQNLTTLWANRRGTAMEDNFPNPVLLSDAKISTIQFREEIRDTKCPKTSEMIIPCTRLIDPPTNNWCRPEMSDVVEEWLAATGTSESSDSNSKEGFFNLGVILMIVVGVLVIIAGAALFLLWKRRQEMAPLPDDLEYEYSRQQHFVEQDSFASSGVTIASSSSPPNDGKPRIETRTPGKLRTMPPIQPKSRNGSSRRQGKPRPKSKNDIARTPTNQAMTKQAMTQSHRDLTRAQRDHLTANMSKNDLARAPQNPVMTVRVKPQREIARTPKNMANLTKSQRDIARTPKNQAMVKQVKSQRDIGRTPKNQAMVNQVKSQRDIARTPKNQVMANQVVKSRKRMDKEMVLSHDVLTKDPVIAREGRTPERQLRKAVLISKSRPNRGRVESYESSRTDSTSVLSSTGLDEVNLMRSHISLEGLDLGVNDFVKSENIQVLKVLGSGTYGEVLLAKYSGVHVAVKKMHPWNSNPEEFAHEVKVLKSVRHPSIVQFLGVTDYKDFGLCSICEFMERGDLLKVLQDKSLDITWESEKHSIALDTVLGLAYLHQLSPPLIHRDLKSRNILIGKSFNAKLADFGLVREISTETMTITGSTLWVAPEMYRGEAYTEKADVYSFGIVLSEIDTGHLPFYDAKNTEGDKLNPMAIAHRVAFLGLRPTLTPACPDFVKDLVKKCTHPNPRKRPSAAQAADTFQSHFMI